VPVDIEGGNRVSLGNMYRMARASLNGRLIVLNADIDHKVTLMRPNRFLARNDVGRIVAEGRVSIPANEFGSRYVFEADVPIGKVQPLAFVALEDFQVDRIVANGYDRISGSRCGQAGESAADQRRAELLTSFTHQIRTWLA
jgi:hypothetical protein